MSLAPQTTIETTTLDPTMLDTTARETASATTTPAPALRVLIVPPMPWMPERIGYRPGEAPDPLALYRHMAALGITAELIDPHGWPLNPFGGQVSLLEALDPYRALQILLRRRRADVVVCVFEGGAVPLLLLRRLLAFKVPVVLWDLGLTEEWKLRERALDFVVPRCDGLLVLNSSQIDYIRKRWSPRAPIEVLTHHIDADFFQPSGKVDQGSLLSVGDDVGRDFDTLVAATAGLATEVVVKTRRDVPAAANVRVVRERISYGALRELYDQCSVVVVPLKPTLNASGVSTILEAGAMGKPLIVTDLPSIRDFIVPDETCLAVLGGDVAALQSAITRLLGDGDLRAQLGANAQRFVRQNFADPAIARRLAGFLHRFARPRA